MTGIAFALSAAAFWALATRLFTRMAGFWTPAALAMIKSLVSLVLFDGGLNLRLPGDTIKQHWSSTLRS